MKTRQICAYFYTIDLVGKQPRLLFYGVIIRHPKPPNSLGLKMNH
jgi:hypothetical protein